jgi:hypothetical protein
MEQLPLKDIHLPQQVSWWPLAPGWWLACLLLLILLLLGVYLYKRLKQQVAYRTAGKMLLALRDPHKPHDLQALVALSALLRRVAISHAGRTDVAALSGAAWLAWLDRPFPDQPFSNGVGRCLADAQYRQTLAANTDMEALFKLCERWLKSQKPPLFSLPAVIAGWRRK